MAEPRVGVGALITDDDGRVLLVQRRREPEAGCWGFPGGKVDFGETLRAACAREIAEELGVEIAVDEVIRLIDQIDFVAGMHWVAPVYRCRILAGEAANREPQAIAAIGWFAADALPAPLTQAAHETLSA